VHVGQWTYACPATRYLAPRPPPLRQATRHSL
jgi:hypothetical protein